MTPDWPPPPYTSLFVPDSDASYQCGTVREHYDDLLVGGSTVVGEMQTNLLVPALSSSITKLFPVASKPHHLWKVPARCK